MWPPHSRSMMTSSNGNIFRVTVCDWPFVRGIHRSPVNSQRPVTQNFGVSFDLCPNKRLSKQSWGWWFETPSHSLWRHCNDSYWRNDGKKWRFLKFDRFAGSKQLCNDIVYSSVGYISLDNPLVSSKIFQECWWQTLILVSEQTACMCCSPFKADELYLCVSKLDHHWFR